MERKKSPNSDHIQDKIYQKMPVRKKLQLVDEFYKTGKILDNLKHGRTYTNQPPNKNR